MKSRFLFVFLLGCPLLGSSQPSLPCTIAYQTDGPTNQIRIGWTAVPARFYTILVTEDLSVSWRVLNPVPLSAASNDMTYLDETTLPQRFYRVVNGDIPFSMAWIPPGAFLMGSPESEVDRNSGETQHAVTISRGFWMDNHEVTQAEFLDVLGINPSYFNGDRSGAPFFDQDYGTDLSRPAEQVSWFDAVAYCQALTQQARVAGRLPDGYAYRLPTEAEWEYACRAGTTTAFHYGPALLSALANFDGTLEYDAAVGTLPNPLGIFLARTTPVRSYAPNAWGLYDMHGNVWEWVQDWHGPYPLGSVTDPSGPLTGSFRVQRGGSWYFIGWWCRSANRGGDNPASPYNDYGFRVVLAPGQP